jgi:outer membrane protein OmpA-like peptidoglycan-associated protein
MRNFKQFIFIAAACLILAAPTLSAQEDTPGSKDFPGITRMPNTFIRAYVYSKYDSAKFSTGRNTSAFKVIEGEKFFIAYKLKPGNAPGSALETVRNYENAVKSKGGTVVYGEMAGSSGYSTMRFSQSGSTIWLMVEAWTVEYQLTIIKVKDMDQQVTVDAAAMENSLADSGRVALYGIFFDTAKSDLKPESMPAIEQIAKLLKDNPTLRVYIVGHTDMVGDAASNVKLSQARAQSVINELVKNHSIAATRLLAFGAGPYAPIASNRTDDGRAKNRRVELVEIATK